MARLLGLLLACSLVSCSWALVDGPPPRAPRGIPVRCTTAYGAPGLDAAIATLLGIGAIALVGLAAYGEDGDETTGFIAGGTLYGVTALGFGMSAAGGFRDVRACRRVFRSVPGPLLNGAPGS